ncbi:MAG TPA: hypothetical protein DCL77_12195 [Prolixibacteraceae bacterium]|nr:hypothetical protein [Prolixibacteraceae bacterium]
MKENRNDRQYGQTSSGQQQNEVGPSNEKRMNQGRNYSGSTMDSEPFDPEDSNTSIDQPQTRSRRSKEGTWGSEGSPSSFSGRERSGEYSSDDEFDEMDELEDDDMVSRTEEEDDEL